MRLRATRDCNSNTVSTSVYFSLRDDSENEELDASTPEEITLDETKGGTYLSLDEIGVFLSRLPSNGIYLTIHKSHLLLQMILKRLWDTDTPIHIFPINDLI